jgi:hypothetical protein
MIPISARFVARCAALKPRAILCMNHCRARKPLWHASMLVVLKSLRGSVYVVHGFRATFSGDWAAKAGYSLELRERALHHVVGDSSLVAYNRDELVEQRRPMMAAWAKFAIGTR